MTNYAQMNAVLREIATNAACGAAYPTWDDKFAREEVSRAWHDKEAPLRRVNGVRFTADDIRALSKDAAAALGFAMWDDESGLLLIPLWIWNYIEDGTALQSISGKQAVKGTDVIDLDIRFGCIAWGIPSAPTADFSTTIGNARRP